VGVRVGVTLCVTTAAKVVDDGEGVVTDNDDGDDTTEDDGVELPDDDKDTVELRDAVIHSEAELEGLAPNDKDVVGVTVTEFESD
jgi:hypothetical protein